MKRKTLQSGRTFVKVIVKGRVICPLWTTQNQSTKQRDLLGVMGVREICCYTGKLENKKSKKEMLNVAYYICKSIGPVGEDSQVKFSDLLLFFWIG